MLNAGGRIFFHATALCFALRSALLLASQEQGAVDVRHARRAFSQRRSDATRLFMDEMLILWVRFSVAEVKKEFFLLSQRREGAKGATKMQGS